jgi:hypothetical protein
MLITLILCVVVNLIVKAVKKKNWFN